MAFCCQGEMQPARLFSWSLERSRTFQKLLISVVGTSRTYRSTSSKETKLSPAPVENDSNPLPDQESSLPTELVPKPWSKGSRRTGVIAIKLGMTQMWDKEGNPMAATVLQVTMLVKTGELTLVVGFLSSCLNFTSHDI